MSLEVGLRVAGFEFTGIPTHVQFGANIEDGLQRNVLEEDPLLFWRARWGPDTASFLEGCGALQRGQAARAVGGNPGAEPLVVALGDSCTLFGKPPYSRRLEELLRARLPRARVLNAGVPGYSSLQGRRWFTDEIAALEPDWVTVYFGWNDHWLSYQVPDDAVGARRLASGSAAGRALGRLRIVQLARAIGTKLNAPPADRKPLRVPPEHYRVNLAAICQEAREVGARVAFITAPSAITPAMARMLRERGYVADVEGLAALHEIYNTASRDVAAQCGATLVDFAAAADPASLLTADGIHLAPAGVDELAGRLSRVILADPAKPPTGVSD